MTAARELIERLAEIGATVRPAGNNRLIVHAGAKPVPAELVQRLRQAKAEVLAAIAPTGHAPEKLNRRAPASSWWFRRFTIRTIARELGGHRSHQEAELLAFGDMILEWHRQHGIRPDPRRCAGCSDELPDFAGIVVGRDGARVHFDSPHGVDCITAYGTRWRGAAVAALTAIGVDPPGGFELL